MLRLRRSVWEELATRQFVCTSAGQTWEEGWEVVTDRGSRPSTEGRCVFFDCYSGNTRPSCSSSFFKLVSHWFVNCFIYYLKRAIRNTLGTSLFSSPHKNLISLRRAPENDQTDPVMPGPSVEGLNLLHKRVEAVAGGGSCVSEHPGSHPSFPGRVSVVFLVLTPPLLPALGLGAGRPQPDPAGGHVTC